MDNRGMNESRDLFAASGEVNVPLAERLRPKTVDEMVGQQHLLAEGKPIRVALRAGKPHSMILWGPPGVGKTWLARLRAHAFNAEFIAISAVLSGVKEIRDAVERARLSRDQFGRSTILFVDEVHRFNKAQQDAFLPHVESGLLTFIGATTENPSFEVIGALLSRAQVYVLESLSAADLDKVIVRGFEEETINAAEVYERLGTPEGELALAECVIYLAVAAKSNAVYAAYNQARAFIAEDGTRPVPLHIRNAPTKLMKNLGYGKDYRYAHDEDEAYAAGESYFPDGMERPGWYRPTDRGLEAKIRA